MINQIELSGQHTEVTDDLRKYVTKKIARLDRYVSRKSRDSLHADIKLKEGKAKDKKQFTCEVILHLPQETISASETAINMFAAVDIVETKLKQQLHKYKELHGGPQLHRKVLAKLRGKE